MARADELVLEIAGGTSISGWKEIELARSIEAASGTFRLATTIRKPIRVREGDLVSVRLAGELVLVGHIDDVVVEGDERSRSLTVAGRDLSGDLVDCSATNEDEFEDLPFAVLVSELAEPFGVEVRFDRAAEGAQDFDLFRLQPGETAWNAIERACRLRGFLAFPAGDGALLVARAGRTLAKAELVEGRNLLRYSVATSARQRFQSYIVRGQANGSDDYFGEQAALAEGSALDPGVGRFRPLLVLAEGVVTFEDARDRAQWEATVRAARAVSVVVSVQGWRQQAGGPVWALNELTRVLVSSIGLDRIFLVSGLRFARDGEGDKTEITLTRRTAYQPEPEVDPTDELEYGDD